MWHSLNFAESLGALPLYLLAQQVYRSFAYGERKHQGFPSGRNTQSQGLCLTHVFHWLTMSPGDACRATEAWQCHGFFSKPSLDSALCILPRSPWCIFICQPWNKGDLPKVDLPLWGWPAVFSGGGACPWVFSFLKVPCNASKKELSRLYLLYPGFHDE